MTTAQVPHTARAMARAAIAEAILDSARRQLGEVGPAALSLRAVARDVGMVSSAVYRYVASRDELLTELIIAAYDELGAAVEAAEDAVPAAGLEGRWLAMSTAVRQWALAHPHDWALLYGTPVPGYAAPERTVGPATRVVLRLMRILVDAQEEGVRANASEVDDRLHHGIAGLRAFVPGPVDDALLVRGIGAWATLVGVISLELFGHLVNGVDDHEAHFAHVARTLAGDLGIAGS
uniref:Transcriptional regulator, AcrR family n=1 Tax=uncultured Nocardioidaceae bacterium TaxID=253824 RepID=A0A6J4MLA8_9ACTN|nr:MAG: Transcriptional regulator, AcrR family [uncultured Nocardioidaceae bacterium]